MRILIHAIGSAGDVHPFIGVGVAMKKRGHDVHLVTAGLFEEAVVRSGLTFHGVGTPEDFKKLRDNPDIWHPRKSMKLLVREAMGKSYGPILEITRALDEPGNTVMLASSLAFGARNPRELLGIPLATVHLSPCLFPSIHRQPDVYGAPFGQGAPKFLKALQWRIADMALDQMILPKLNAFRKTHGLAPARNVFSKWWHSPDLVLALFPGWFAPPQPDWPAQTRLTGFPLFDEKGIRGVPPDLEDFLKAGEAPVIFTPGSAMARGHAFFREAVKALQRLGRRGILLTTFTETVPAELPANVRHFPYIPFSAVLPRAAALVYHGGIGTCSQALQAGIPHLVQPMAHDQLDTLGRVRDLGVGLGLRPSRFKDRKIAAMLGELLGDPAYKARAREIAGAFEPELWMRRTCEAIEALLPAHGAGKFVP